MSEYNRFVSYMYVYENNTKVSNNGFVRVETKDHRCFIYIHMKNLFTDAGQPLKVYMVRRCNQLLEGIFLGDMNTQKQPAEFFYQTTPDNIEHSGTALTDMAGIIVFGENGKQYGTCWDDDNLDMNAFVPAGQMRAQVEVEKESSEAQEMVSPTIKNIQEIEILPKEISTANSKTTEVSNHEITTSEPVNPEISNQLNISNQPESTKYQTTSQQQLETPATPAASSSAVSAEEIAATPCFGGVPELSDLIPALSNLKNTVSKKYTLPERLEKVIAQAEHMYPFEDDTMYACVRLDLQDIGLLPVKFWMYAGNSFVLHQYYSYRHLLLCKTHAGQYLLCVPGLHREKDRYMAENFGFSDFKPIHANAQSHDNDFGYWYITLFNTVVSKA